MKARSIIYSAINLIAALAIYSHLISGGWLRTRYELSDPNIVNLLLAIYEPVAVVVVLAYWVRRSRALYRALFISFVLQIVILAAFAVFILFFFVSWKPKMM